MIRETANKIQQMSRDLDPNLVLEAFLKAGWKILRNFPQLNVTALHPTTEDYSLGLTDRWALIGRKQLSTDSKLWCFPDEGAIELLEAVKAEPVTRRCGVCEIDQPLEYWGLDEYRCDFCVYDDRETQSLAESLEEDQ